MVRTELGREIIVRMLQEGVIEGRPGDSDPGAIALMHKLSAKSRQRWPAWARPRGFAWDCRPVADRAAETPGTPWGVGGQPRPWITRQSAKIAVRAAPVESSSSARILSASSFTSSSSFLKSSKLISATSRS